MSLNEILQRHFGCEEPFLKQKRVVGYWTGREPEPDYEYMTQAGGKAYGNLVALLYDLEKLLGPGFDANKLIGELDRIVSGEP